MNTTCIKEYKGFKFAILLILAIVKLGNAQVDQNFIIERVYQQAGGKEDSVLATVKYFDGLGRPIQTVAVGLSPDRNDIVTPVGYDALGREHRKYLPYEGKTATGLYRPNDLTPAGYSSSEQYLYYKSGNTNNYIPDTDFPFAETVFEASPLSRVLEQGAPGEEWQTSMNGATNGGHTVKKEYGTNTLNDVIQLSVSAEGFLFNYVEKTTGLKYCYYPANTLYKTTIKNENWTAEDGKINTDEEYSNLQGQVVLKRTYVKDAQNLVVPIETYYAYDDLGHLRYVLPPLAAKDMPMPVRTLYQPWGYPAYYRIMPISPSDSIIKSLCYYYSYDGRGRMITKQLPGADPIYMVYDQRDRLVATQDGNQREAGKWIITKYDALNRPVSTAEYNSSTSHSDMQSLADSYTSEPSLYEIRDNSKVHGYTERSFPGDIDDNSYLTVTYYDKYEFPGKLDFYDANGMSISGYSDNSGDPRYFDSLKGLVTGSKVRVLDTDKWLTTTNYYDNRYQVIQSRSDLYDGSNGGRETVSSKYDFSGKVLQTKQRQEFGTEATTVGRSFTYDHAGRLLRTKQEINGMASTTISELDYNDLGQLKDKKLGDGLQSVDYTYNIRGWLTGINNPNNLSAAENGDTHDDLFAMQLLYTSTVPGLTAQAQFNGNISGIIMNRKNDNTATFTRIGQGFSYDALNRLTDSDYGEGDNFATNADAYSEYGITYDLNGNIKTLKRNSETIVDNLTYTYIPNSNQLQSVADATTNALGFKDVAGTDYSYDANGNLTQDNNKGITAISYNLLNLPSVLSKDENNSITYIYSATGAKLCKVARVNGALSKRYYAGGFEYDNTKALALMHTGEGLVEVSTTDGVKTYSYEYFLKDHLGNTRVVFNSSGEVVQRTDYYPFGMTSGLGYNGNPDNKYLYNGKELQQELALDWYDYGARFYDPTLGRWHTPDPKAEISRRWSPYVYAYDNPVRFIDPDGMEAVDPDDIKKAATAAVKHVKDTYDKDGTKSAHCNKGVSYAFEKLTGSKQLNDKDANAISKEMAKSKDWKSVDIKSVQELANNGEIVVAAYINPKGSGHVALAVPGEAVQSGTWNKEPASDYGGLPNVMDTGAGMRTEGQKVSLSFGKDKHNSVVFYQYTGSTVSNESAPSGSGGGAVLSAASLSDRLHSSNVPIVKTLGDIVEAFGH